MSFGKRAPGAAAPTRYPAPHPPAATPPATRPGWWSTYLLALLAALAAHLVLALVVATYASSRSDHGFRDVFMITAGGIVGLMIVHIPIFVLVGGLLRWIGVTNRWLYVPAVAAAALATVRGIYQITSLPFDLWALALAGPSTLAGSLVLAWGLRAKV